MPAAARKPDPAPRADEPAPAAPTPNAAAPVRRPRHLREAEAATRAAGEPVAPPAPTGHGEVRRLQDRVAEAFTSPSSRTLETTLMRLIILAATCLFLRTAIVGGGGFVAGLLQR